MGMGYVWYLFYVVNIFCPFTCRFLSIPLYFCSLDQLFSLKVPPITVAVPQNSDQEVELLPSVPPLWVE